MNACREFAALLDPFVDGELSPEEAARVQSHLEACGSCRSYVDDALAIRSAFPCAEDAAVPDGFAEGVLAAIRAEAAPRPKARRKTPWTKVLLPLAACCALVILVQRVPWGGPPAESAPDRAESAPASAAPAEGGEAQPFLASPAGESQDSTAQAQETVPEEAAPEPRTSPTAKDADDPAQENVQADAPMEPAAQSIAPPAQTPAAEDGGTGRAPFLLESGEAPAADAGAGEALLGEDGPGAAEEWVEHGNVVFAATVFLTLEEAGDALEGLEGKPYSDADLPERGVLGTGYALEQADFERILAELGRPLDPAPNQDPTTELRCIVVTDGGPAAN